MTRDFRPGGAWYIQGRTHSRRGLLSAPESSRDAKTISNKPRALPIAAKLTTAQGACRLAQSVCVAPQLIDIDNLIQPNCVSTCVLPATRDAKSARRKQNRSVRRRELRRVSPCKLSAATDLPNRKSFKEG